MLTVIRKNPFFCLLAICLASAVAKVEPAVAQLQQQYQQQQQQSQSNQAQCAAAYDSAQFGMGGLRYFVASNNDVWMVIGGLNYAMISRGYLESGLKTPSCLAEKIGIVGKIFTQKDGGQVSVAIENDGIAFYVKGPKTNWAVERMVFPALGR